MHNQANYQQPVQNTQSQSNHTDQGDDDDFPEDDDLSQFAVENANQDLIPVDDFPEDGMDDDDLLAAAVAVEDAGWLKCFAYPRDSQS